MRGAASARSHAFSRRNKIWQGTFLNAQMCDAAAESVHLGSFDHWHNEIRLSDVITNVQICIPIAQNDYIQHVRNMPHDRICSDHHHHQEAAPQATSNWNRTDLPYDALPGTIPQIRFLHHLTSGQVPWPLITFLNVLLWNSPCSHGRASLNFPIVRNDDVVSPVLLHPSV